MPLAEKKSGPGSQKRGSSGKPTTYHVASLAKVSQMTVSRVMRKEGSVSQEVSEKVWAAANALGYVPNRIAGALAGTATNLVGVVLPALSNAVFTEVLAGLTEGLGRSGMQPVFGVSDYNPETEENLVRDMLAWRPAGIILTGLEHTEVTRKILGGEKIKIAEIIDVDGMPISACFGLSQEAAGRTMARFLIERGYRRFGYVGSNLTKDLRAGKRRAAFRSAIREAGASLVAEQVADAPSSMLLGRQLTGEILSSGKDIDALYYSNDDLAAGGLMHCLAEGIDIPGQVALASFNGLDFLEALPLRITTIRSPRFQIGRMAGEFMSVANEVVPDDRVVALPFELIKGDTA